VIHHENISPVPQPNQYRPPETFDSPGNNYEQ